MTQLFPRFEPRLQRGSYDSREPLRSVWPRAQFRAAPDAEHVSGYIFRAADAYWIVELPGPLSCQQLIRPPIRTDVGTAQLHRQEAKLLARTPEYRRKLFCGLSIVNECRQVE